MFNKNRNQRIAGIAFAFSLFVHPAQCAAQLIATFNISKNAAGPVSVNLDKITPLPDSLLQLAAVNGSKRTPVNFQVENRYHRFLWWMPSKNGTVYQLSKTAVPEHREETVTVTKENGGMVIKNNGRSLLKYNSATVYPPKGVDTAFRRSGFIHPLWSPAGNVLTRINPPDHYHHFGVWNPWTNVLFEGKEVDFWNLYKKQGSVRFSKLLRQESGAIYAGIRTLQEHVVFDRDKGEKTAMNEIWDVRAYPVSDRVWICDFTSVLSCATDSPVTLQEYRYGGFGFRATEQWDNENSDILTSENKTRKDADASIARWCMIDGDVGNDHSGILFMSHPSNYNYPEPMRVWPENMNKRGDVFFSFSPTRNKDWELVPGQSYVLRYRMLLYEGKINADEAEAAWKSFVNPADIDVQISRNTN